MGAQPLEELLAFARAAPEVDTGHVVPSLPVPSAPSASIAPVPGGPPPPRLRHVPDWLPPFPDPMTYERTTAHNARAADPQRARKRRSKHRRDAQESLLNLQALTAAQQARAATELPCPGRSLCVRGLGHPQLTEHVAH